jgi:hypothetical protein
MKSIISKKNALIDQEVLSEKLDKFYKCEEEIG